MLTELEIKEEPLDENENQQETFNKQQQNVLSKELIKDEPEDVDSAIDDNFRIVEEHDQFITVSAGDMKTQDELQFIEKLQNIQNSFTSKFSGVCPNCLKTFVKQSAFENHAKRNNCIAKQKCPVCPLTFINSPSLLNHLNLHRENFFFCSQNCGAQFRTLPMCEEHEIRNHKMKNPPKIRYKHFCSFCREGFKTELQLHVHWLQQNQGCGKLMQDVALYSNNITANGITNNINNTATNDKHKDEKKSPTGSTKNTPATAVNSSALSITKLRLKSVLPSPLPNKRSTVEDVNDEIQKKRMKFVNRLKSKMTNNDEILFSFNTDLEIKDEPLDDEDVMNTTPPLIAADVIIKTEEEKMEEERDSELKNESQVLEMKSLLINNNKMLNPEFQGKIIPLSVQTVPKIPPLQRISNYSSNDNNNNNNNNVISNSAILSNSHSSLKNITNLKFIRLAPSSNGVTTRLAPNLQIIPLQQQQQPPSLTTTAQNDFKIVPTPKMSLQIIKKIPNIQVVTLRNDQQHNNDVQQQIHMLKSQPVNATGQVSAQPTNIKIMKISTATTSPETLTVSTTRKTTNSPPLPKSTVSSSDEFKRLQTEALLKAEEHRIQYISKKNLVAIESLPEKKELIHNLKQQIAKVVTGENSLDKNKSTPSLLNFSPDASAASRKNNNGPPTLYLPIMSAIDVELVEARYKYPEYLYKWICPYCLKDYDIKRCLKSHLSKAHNLTSRDMDKINVQAKAFKNEEVTIELEVPLKQEVDESIPDSSASETGSTSATPLTTDPPTKPTPEPIKMSALRASKPRYMCAKCGRKCSSKTMLNDHVSANCSREPQYPCSECPKKFYSLSTLQCHLTIHTGELPHKCSYCDKRFRTRGQVTVHHRTHTGERPFVCQVCSQRFTHRETLIAHLSRHIGMKRYKCYCCDKHFSCISALKTHREIRPDTCGKVKFNPRAVGPRVRVVRGNVIFEAQPEINPYLRSEDPKSVLAELQNQPETVK